MSHRKKYSRPVIGHPGISAPLAREVANLRLKD